MSTDFGDFVYKDNKLVGFYCSNGDYGNELCPSFEIFYDEQNNILRIASEPSHSPERSGWMATWCGIVY